MTTAKLRYCSKCGQQKPLRSFASRGKSTICLACEARRRREARKAENPRLLPESFYPIWWGRNVGDEITGSVVTTSDDLMCNVDLETCQSGLHDNESMDCLQLEDATFVMEGKQGASYDVVRVPLHIPKMAIWSGNLKPGQEVHIMRTETGFLCDKSSVPFTPPDVDEPLRDMLFSPLSAERYEVFFNRYSSLVLSPLHLQVVRDAFAHPRIVLNMPPRHGKSTVFSEILPVYLLCRNRQAQIILVSQGEKLVKQFANKCAFLMETNRLLIKDVGPLRPDSSWPWQPSLGNLVVAGRARAEKSASISLCVRGCRQDILGMEADWVIVDDPVDPRGMQTIRMREDTLEWLKGQVLTRLVPGGRAIIVGQRVALRDLYSSLIAETAHWHHINYPAVLDWGNKVALWPEVLPFEHLMERQQDLGEELFSCYFQQKPMSEGRRLARSEWIFGDADHVGCLDLERRVGEGVDESTLDLSQEAVVRVVSLDPGMTRFTALTTADVVVPTRDMSRPIVIHVIEQKRKIMSVRDTYAELERLEAIYRNSYLVVESNAYQKAILESKEADKLRQHGVTIIPHTTSGPVKSSPAYGIYSLALDFEFGRIRLPWGCAESRAMSEMLIEEAQQYPDGDADDLLMTYMFIKSKQGSLFPKMLVQSARPAPWPNPGRRVTYMQPPPPPRPY